jgi:Ca2+-binding EF-hand superfamily protein
MQNAQEVKLFLSRLGNQIGRSGVDAAFAEMLQIHRDVRDKRGLDAFQVAAKGSNTLDRDQVDVAIASLFDCLRGTECEDAYSQMAHDNAGRVTQSAFLKWWDKEEYGNWEDDSELREVFARVDVDGGGTIDKIELEEVFDDLGNSLSSIFGTSKLDAAFAAMLPDAEGEVSYENFKHWWLKSRAENEPPEISFAAFEIWYWRRISAEQAQQETRIVELFERIDADGSGVLDKQEVAALAAELGTKLKGAFKSSTDLEEAFAEMDPDGDEAVTLDEFRSWWHQKKDPPVVEFKVFEEWYWRRMQAEKEQNEARIRQVFERIDLDASGTLDKQEVAALSRELGEKLSTAFSTKKLDQAFTEMDPVRFTQLYIACAVDSQAIRTGFRDY